MILKGYFRVTGPCQSCPPSSVLPQKPLRALPIILSAVSHQITMSESEDDDYPFEWRSGDLMTWIKQQVGARVSPKVELVDLRGRGAGRGVGIIFLHVATPTSS